MGTRIYSTIDEGDIIVFRHDGRLLVKRIAVMPGGMADWYGPQKESEACLRQTPQSVEVPLDCYFVLGDNRGNSLDSRYWNNPFVREKDVVAKVLLPTG